MTYPGKLYFTVGMARCGKSTFCDNWVNIVGDRPRVIVCGDDIHRALHGDEFHQECHPLVLCHMDIMARAHLLRGCDVIMDETATSEATIRRYLAIDPEAEPVLLQTPLEVCLFRAHQTFKPYLIPVIHRHHRNLEELLPDWPSNLERWREGAREKRANA